MNVGEPEREQECKVSSTALKKAYHKPLLTIVGDVRGLTLGPTIGTGESGGSATYRGGPMMDPGMGEMDPWRP